MTNRSSLSGLLTSICHCSFVICHLTENPCHAAKNFHVSSTDKHGFCVYLWFHFVRREVVVDRSQVRRAPEHLVVTCNARECSAATHGRGSIARQNQVRRSVRFPFYRIGVFLLAMVSYSRPA